jgi:arginine repressor
LIGTRTEAESRLQREQGAIQEGLYRTQGDIEARLAERGYSHEQAMQERDIAWNKLDLQARMDVEMARMDQEDKTRWNDTTNQIASEYSQNYLNILADPNYETPEDRAVAIDALNENTIERYRIAGSIAGTDLNWGLTVVNDPGAGYPVEGPAPGLNWTTPIPDDVRERDTAINKGKVADDSGNKNNWSNGANKFDWGKVLV